jgi:hypothetical protein
MTQENKTQRHKEHREKHRENDTMYNIINEETLKLFSPSGGYTLRPGDPVRGCKRKN